MKKSLLVASIIASSSFIFSTAEADIVTSIKPLGFIAASIADGVTNVDVLLKGNQSPHTFSLTPQLLETIKKSDLVVYISDDLEISLGKALENERLRPKLVLEVSDNEEIQRQLVKGFHYDHSEGDSEGEDHDHDHDHDHKHEHEHEHDHNHNHDHDHDHDNDHENKVDDDKIKDSLPKGIGFDRADVEFETNYHLWTSPTFAKLIASDIARELKELYPNKATTIQENLDKFNNSLDQTVVDIKMKLHVDRFVNYYVYHDAYTYFEKDFGFRNHNRGALYFNVSIDPSAKDLAELHKKSNSENIKVIFSEPQFNQNIAKKLARSSKVKLSLLDPLGSTISVTPGSYNTYLLQLADEFSAAEIKK